MTLGKKFLDAMMSRALRQDSDLSWDDWVKRLPDQITDLSDAEFREMIDIV